jgi:hypothetical protein
MKIFSSISILLVMLMTSAFAQPAGFKYYTRGGIGTSTFIKEKNSTQAGKIAFNIGMAAHYQFNKNIGFIVEGNFVSKGSRIMGVEPGSITSMPKNYEDVYKLFYAEIPFMLNLSYPVNDMLYIRGFSGLSYNLNLLGTYSRDYNESNNQDFYDQKIQGLNLTEFSVVYGFGLCVVDKTEHYYNLDFRVNTALNSFGEIRNSENTMISGYNNYYTIGIGYSF